jgi:hypothetical protein
MRAKQKAVRLIMRFIFMVSIELIFERDGMIHGMCYSRRTIASLMFDRISPLRLRLIFFHE